MGNSINPPKLKTGQYSVLRVDVNTGVVLLPNGAIYIGKGEMFKLFNCLSDAEKFIEKQIEINSNLEFVIYDCTGEALLLVNRFERKNF